MTTETSGFVAVEVNSRFEPFLLDRICKPVLDRVPARVTPNSISMANAVVCWMVFGLAALSPFLAPDAALTARLLAGAGTFASMVLDCLDGMQARKTNQCSRLGEVLDHWLDAIHVPLSGAGFILTLGVSPLTVALAGLATVLVYNAQLVIYHHTRKFVHPPTSGADAQFIMALAYAAVGLTFYYVPRSRADVDLVVSVGVWVVIATQYRQVWFYYVRLRDHFAKHLRFLALAAVFTGLYLAGAMSGLAYLLLTVFASFRVTGTYVLRTVLRRPYDGIDVPLWVGAVATGAAHFLLPGRTLAGLPLATFVLVATCAVAVVRNVADIARALPDLRRR